MKYKILILCSMLFYLLAGCDSYADPYQQIEAAQAEIRATQRAANEREREEVETARRATQQAMEKQDAAQAEIDLMNAKALGTQTALELQIRQFEAAALAAQATRAAGEYGLAMQATSQAGEATATAMAIEMENARKTAERDAESARRLMLAKLAASWVAVLGLWVGLTIGMIYLWRWLDWKIEWTNRKNSIFTTAAGNTIVYVLTNGELLPQLMDGAPRKSAIRFGPVDGQEVQQLTRSGSVLASAPARSASPEDEMRQAAITLIEASIERNGEDDQQIPRYDHIDWSSGKWQSVVGWLRDRKMVYSNTTGTFVTLQSLAHTRVELMSTPPAPR